MEQTAQTVEAMVDLAGAVTEPVVRLEELVLQAPQDKDTMADPEQETVGLLEEAVVPVAVVAYLVGVQEHNGVMVITMLVAGVAHLVAAAQAVAEMVDQLPQQVLVKQEQLTPEVAVVADGAVVVLPAAPAGRVLLL